MPRAEFSKKTMREAKARAGGLCEAVGAWYGLEAGKRCNSPLDKGVQYDHLILDHNSKDNSLANCRAVCIPCHRRKTQKHDVPLAAKTKRQADMRHVTKPRSSLSAPSKQPKRLEKVTAGMPEIFRRMQRI